MKAKAPKKALRLDLSEMKKKWPSAIVSREEIRNFTGGAVSEKYMANLDGQQKGPEGRFKIGRKVAYPIDSLLRWLEARIGE